METVRFNQPYVDDNYYKAINNVSYVNRHLILRRIFDRLGINKTTKNPNNLDRILILLPSIYI